MLCEQKRADIAVAAHMGCNEISPQCLFVPSEKRMNWRIGNLDPTSEYHPFLQWNTPSEGKVR